MDPITGISSEGYQGEGFVQSPPRTVFINYPMDWKLWAGASLQVLYILGSVACGLVPSLCSLGN